MLLPEHLPQQYFDNSHVYAIVEERSSDYYSVDLAATPGCNGAHACSYAHIVGSKKPLTPGYVASTCTAYCDDATLTWKQGDEYYQIGLKAGSLEALRVLKRSMRPLH